MQESGHLVYHELANAADRQRGLLAASALIRRCASTRLARPRPVVPISLRIQAQNLHDSVSWLLICLKQRSHHSPCANMHFCRSSLRPRSFCAAARKPAALPTPTLILPATAYTLHFRLHQTRTDIDVASDRRERARATEHALCP